MTHLDPNRLRAGAVALVVAAAIASPAITQGAVFYRLDKPSNFLEGCFDPCLCPIMMNGTLAGSFVALPVSDDGSTAIFDVVDVNWSFVRLEHEVEVTGSGRYTTEPERQRLELDLLVGDEAVQHFDSGWTPRAGDLPAISIAVSVNGYYCYDRVFDIEAHPSTVGIEPAAWGSLKAAWR